VSDSRNGSSAPEERTGLRPKYRRAFGCVTWVYMGMLVFLLANFLLVLPTRYLGGGTLYGYVPPTLAFLGTALILPGMVLAAVLGVRTFRTPRKRGTRVGAAVGALIGYSGFFGLAWLAIAFGFERRVQAFRTVVFPDLGGTPAFYAFVPLTLAATALVIVALYGKNADFERRRNLAVAGAVLAVLAGLGVVATDFDPLGVLGALISTVSAAAGGYVGGAGYARAGGDDMIPPGAEIQPRGPRRERRRKPR
jgi:hypothetical protein